MRRDPFTPRVELVTADDMTAEELRLEIAVLAGLLVDRSSARETCAVLSNIAMAIEPGGRA